MSGMNSADSISMNNMDDMNGRDIAGESFEGCGFSYTLSLINGKYKMTVLYALANFGVVRFNEMKKYIGSISYKTLSATLKELETDRLVHRREYPQIPPRVEYSLTERGRTLMPILDSMCDWGEQNRLPGAGAHPRKQQVRPSRRSTPGTA